MYPRLVSIHYVNEDDLELVILKSPTLELQKCNVPPCLAYAARRIKPRASSIVGKHSINHLSLSGLS